MSESTNLPELAHLVPVPGSPLAERMEVMESLVRRLVHVAKHGGPSNYRDFLPSSERMLLDELATVEVRYDAPSSSDETES